MSLTLCRLRLITGEADKTIKVYKQDDTAVSIALSFFSCADGTLRRNRATRLEWHPHSSAGGTDRHRVPFISICVSLFQMKQYISDTIQRIIQHIE